MNLAEKQGKGLQFSLGPILQTPPEQISSEGLNTTKSMGVEGGIQHLAGLVPNKTPSVKWLEETTIHLPVQRAANSPPNDRVQMHPEVYWALLILHKLHHDGGAAGPNFTE